jgi:hypothetical protein
MVQDQRAGLNRMSAIWEDPEYRHPFDPEEDERHHAERRLATWERETRSENHMRREQGYGLASIMPPNEWDGTTNSALEYLQATRKFPPGTSHAPTPRFNFRSTTDHPLPPSRRQSPSLPIYDGPPPDPWLLNHSLMQTERDRSQGPRTVQPGGSNQGRYHSDVNMHADNSAGSSNAYRTSRFAPNGDGMYAQLQRRL